MRRLALRWQSSPRLWLTLPNEPIWPLATELVELNQYIVASTGEPHSLLKPNELESACARPHNLWVYEDEYRLAYLAVALIVGVAQNHPFAQGNKRTAFVAATMFLQNNGYILDCEDTEEFGPTLEAVMTGEIAEATFAEELDEYLIETLV